MATLSSADSFVSGNATVPAGGSVPLFGVPVGASGGAPVPPPSFPPGVGGGTPPGGSLHLIHAPPPVIHRYATISVKSHVPMTLMMKSSTYTKWASFFKSILNPCFSSTTDNIANSTAGFPSFAQARDTLALKELRLANEEKISNSTALLVGNSLSSSSSSCTGGCGPSSGLVQTGGSSSNSSGSRGGGSGGKKKWQQKKGGGSFQAPPGGSGFHGGGPPWPTGPWFCFSPRPSSYSALGFRPAGGQGGGGWRAGSPGLLGLSP
nr:uncharacterized protein LOC117835394 [Setaria viridis]